MTRYPTILFPTLICGISASALESGSMQGITNLMEEKEMINRKAFAVLGLALASLLALPNAQASEQDQATKLTFSQSVEIPGRVLPAGTYWFMVDPNSSSHIVRIFSQDRSTLYATLLTTSSEQQHPSEGTEVTFASRMPMQPEAIVTWFYPGQTIGHEFLYSKHDQKELAQAKQHTITMQKEVAQEKQHTVPPGN